jgi:hypothetical protein
MIFDGSHRLLTGSYFGGRVGPWADLLAVFGISPGSAAPVFILLGAAWLMGGLSLLLGLRWARLGLILVSLLSLAYLIIGTLLSAVALVLLAGSDKKRGKRRRRN